MATRMPDPNCPRCSGDGSVDSGGSTPWGTPITVACDCLEVVASWRDRYLDDLIRFSKGPFSPQPGVSDPHTFYGGILARVRELAARCEAALAEERAQGAGVLLDLCLSTTGADF